VSQGIIQTAKGAGGGGIIPLPAVEHDWASGQRVAISTSNAYSAAIASPVAQVRPTVDCFITVSPANSGGTASPASATGATSWPLSANETYTVVLTPGYYIAAITASGSGHIYIHPAQDS
jgi:hypothetical protein